MYLIHKKMKYTYIKQHDITDCGAACLMTISRYYGLRTSITRIRQIDEKCQTKVKALLDIMIVKATKILMEARKNVLDYNSGSFPFVYCNNGC